MLEGEVLLPQAVRGHAGTKMSDEALDQLATMLDECFHIPGTRFRVGLDAIVGLIPGLGDVVMGLLSFILVFAAWSRGLPKIALARMMMNIVVDVGVGAIPLLGDAFDVYWKVNRMNYKLLMRYSRSENPRREQVWDWVFLAGMGAVTLCILALPGVVVWLVFHWLWR